MVELFSVFRYNTEEIFYSERSDTLSHRRYTINNDVIKKLDFKFLSISFSTDDKDWKNIIHTHHFTELFFVTKGMGTFYFHDKTYTIQEGDMIIVPPYTQHTERSAENSPLEYYVVGMSGVVFRPEDNRSICHTFCHFEDSSVMADLLYQIMYEMRERKSDYEIICRNLLEILILRLIRSQRLIPEPADIHTCLKECTLIKDFLDTHYSQSINLETLTKLTHTSKYYMIHTFKKYVGLSPMQYLNERRLDAACDLLENTDLSIAAVATECGFSSQSYFTQSFTKKKTMTPRQYRSMHHQ